MHFFIDHTNLPNQTTSDMKFGPDPSNPTNKFNISTQFKLTKETKAFACQSGTMVVQQNALYPNLVNLIIKPSKPTTVNGVNVRYYIYRGIKFDNFFTKSGTTVSITAENANTNSEFMTYYWKIKKAVMAKIPAIKSSPLDIGYGNKNLPTNDPNYLSDQTYIRDIFNGKIKAKSFTVKEGMWIGNFNSSSQISFEIEVESEISYPGQLFTYQSWAVLWNATGLTNFALKRKKEEVYINIDPAAFFGMHTDVGVKAHGVTNPLKGATLYTTLISKFSNKNRVYLDIKSERGMSYNFYNNYKIGTNDPENIVLNQANGLTAVQLNNLAVHYGSNGWPIYYFDTATHQANTSKNKISFRLRIGGNTIPVVFIQNNKYSSSNANNRKCFFKNITETSQTEWTQNITLYYPDDGSTNHLNMATHLTVYYYVGQAVTSGTSRLLNKKYYDSAFCSIDMEGLGDTTIKNGHVENVSPVYIKEPLQTDGTGNFSFASQSGAYWDPNKVLFYSKVLEKRTEDSSGKTYLNTHLRRMNIGNSQFYSDLWNDFYIVCKQYPTATGTLKIPGLNSYHKALVKKEKEDLILLGLTTSELQQIKNTTTGLSSFHPRHIFLERDHTYPLVDTSADHRRYYKYTVKVQGVNDSGVPTMVTPTANIKVYSRDNQFFTSSAFAADQSVSAGANRIEFRIFRDGNIFINDNIDLSLVRKKTITDLQEVGDEPVYTLANDSSIPGDTSAAQTITYIYYNRDTPFLLPVLQPQANQCSLDIVMEDRKEFVSPSSGMTQAEKNAATATDFSNLGYTNHLRDYSDFNDNNVWIKNAYKDNTTGNVMTRGKIPGSSAGNRKYKKINKKIFMVHVDSDIVNASVHINNRFVYEATVRFFASPDLFAVFLGALIKVSIDVITPNTALNNHNVICEGFAFPDATSHPSQYHVNGDAFDIHYFQQEDGNETDDINFIKALYKFGGGLFRIGPSLLTTNLKTQLNAAGMRYGAKAGPNYDYINGGELHDDHLHTERIKIKVTV
ncbi:MAG: hypothetical protein F9K23_08440 [Bacteroidetes bacterium]|nr:MAG: hypothetical protein F9K23_08440 [Bacteroidota bacterium]